MKSEESYFGAVNPFPKNKTGFLLAEETLKVVIAVISISFLIYFLSSIYFSKINEQKKQHAEATLEKIYEKINNQQTEKETLYDPTPFGWHLLGFVRQDKKPNSCAEKNCLCICEKVLWDLKGFNRQIKECDSDGACKIIENLDSFGEIEIKKAPFSIEIIKNPELNIVTIK